MASTLSRCFTRAVSQGLLSSSFRHAAKTTPLFFHRSNLSSDSPSFVNVIKEEGYGIVEMNRKPVNSLSSEMLTELANVIERLEADPSCHGMILTSSLPKIFSAGLDITEFLKGDEQRLKHFWESFQGIWLKLYGSRLATVAAINGAAPAGGCLLAISCDYRIMADDANIGPNETLLGIVAPIWFKNTLVNTVGHRQAERLLCLGKLLDSSEAGDIGLVDRVVEKSGLIAAAREEMQKWLAIPAAARYETKKILRSPILEELLAGREKDTKTFMDFTQKDSTQKLLKLYMKKLAEKSKAKK
ncbi:enoyl-CoA delta isomerase 1, mitochondrial-like isoform X2 [Dendronephthya gigantea]|uniref:enoyl-CoA delta isomerase 1, mitochondrial-like isoform X2 n=1 Tax=Dendronephthya gigantea TaxID=151771 RepID=UPI00106CE0B0|nr:enoyl-CoA delta isomerase 1, mitochondrial-like isoform X2 [Dendronephthya gigantea]